MNPRSTHTSGSLEYPRWSETLHDKHVVLIRPITPKDKAAEREFIERLSPEAKHFRFLGQIGTPSERMLEQFTNIDFVKDVGFVGVVRENGSERIIGVSRYSADADGTRCECAVTVSDEWQHKGLGSLLMKHLIEVARSHGIRTMFSIDSAENIAMSDLARFLGFKTRIDPDDPRLLIHELQL
jgi:GNAT superfamily N-acetyltransferase